MDMDTKARLFVEHYGLGARATMLGISLSALRRYYFDAEYHATVQLIGWLLLTALRPLGAATPGAHDTVA